MITMRKYKYVIIRNEKEIGINEYGFDYLINLEKVLDEIREYIENHRIVNLDEFEYITTSPKVMLQILDKVKEKD